MTTALATALALMTGTLAPPAPASAPGNGQRVVEAQSVQQERAPTTNAPTTAQAPLQLADPKKRRFVQRRNPFRQVRRRMERQGFALTGRQWKQLQRDARKILRDGELVL